MLLCRAGALVLPQELQERCQGTVGDWCGRFFMQKPVPARVRLADEGLRCLMQAGTLDASMLTSLFHALVLASITIASGPRPSTAAERPGCTPWQQL